jgi:hypothetical protein
LREAAPPIRPDIVANTIRATAGSAFRDRAIAAPPRVDNAAFDGFGGPGAASCVDLERSVFARQNTFVTCIAGI